MEVNPAVGGTERNTLISLFCVLELLRHKLLSFSVPLVLCHSTPCVCDIFIGLFCLVTVFNPAIYYHPLKLYSLFREWGKLIVLAHKKSLSVLANLATQKQ